MDKYQVVSILNVCQLVYLIGIILISAIFSNYWLLFLLLLSSIKDSEEMILQSKEQKENKKS